MSKSIAKSLKAFETALKQRNSVLCADKVALNLENILARINASILSTYEERCANTGRLLATWIFHRDENKFILNKQFNIRK